MRFERIAHGLNVAPLLAAIEANADLWHQITVRQCFPGTSHGDTETIYLRGPRAFSVEDYVGDPYAYDYPALDALSPAIADLLGPALQELQVTELGYVLLVKLKPGGHVSEHIDEGIYADHYSRFHLCLAADHGSTLTAGGETQPIAPGEMWWFDHKALHSADNLGDSPRIHLIFDAVTPRFRVPVSA